MACQAARRPPHHWVIHDCFRDDKALHCTRVDSNTFAKFCPVGSQGSDRTAPGGSLEGVELWRRIAALREDMETSGLHPSD